MLQKFAWSTLGILATLYISVYLLVRWGQTNTNS
jgi:hypothetical protein